MRPHVRGMWLAEQMARVVGVHGIFQYKYHSQREALAAFWENPLVMQSVMERGQFSLAYYADVLHGVTSMGDDPFADASDAEAELAGVWLSHTGIPRVTAQGRLTAPLRDAIDWCISTGALRGATRALVRSALREVAIYLDLDAPGPRRQAQARVAELIRAERPDVVIAHSLGSVVAYETLWEHPDLVVPSLITLGSPLALPGVFYHALEATGAHSHSRPPNVGRWVNIADSGDLVAVPKDLASRFSGVDEQIMVEIDRFECHRIVWYLQSPIVAGAIQAELARSVR